MQMQHGRAWRMISWVITTAALLSPSAPVRPVDAATTQVHSAQDGAAAQNGASFASPRSEAGILQLAARIVEASPALAQIWPGSWPEDQPFVINLPGTGAFLVAAGAAPPGWAPVASERLPPGLRGRTYFRASPIEGESRPFILRFALDDGRTAIFVNADMDAKATAGLLLHEQFHVFQGAAFEGQNRQFVSPAAVTDRVAFAASAELERRILAAALAAPPAEQRQLLRTYFLVRRERESMVPAEAREVERGYERTEGTARYVDRVAQAALFGGEVDRLIVHDLTDTLMDNHGPFVTVWFRDRSYATGAALTHLLSRVQPTGWRTMIEADGDPAALLEARLSPHTNPRRAVSGAKARFGYAQLLRDMRGLIEAGARTEIKTEADFLALGAYPVTIKLPPHVKSQPAMNPTFLPATYPS